MSAEQQLEQQLFELGEMMTADNDFTSSVMERIGSSSVVSARTSVGSAKARSFWRLSCTLLAIVAVAALMIWLGQTNDQSEIAGNNWWLGSSAVYAGEIVDAIRKAQVTGIVFRSSTTYVLEDGSEEKASNVDTIAVVGDRYRYESTRDQRIASITWAVPDNGEFVVTKYFAHDGSTRVRRLPGEQGLGASPLNSVLEVGRLMDQASRKMGPKNVDGHECVGFEINANRVHKKHKSGIYQIWIDTKTKRPVKMTFDRERTMRDERDIKIKRSITVMDRFEWNPNLPDDTFEPHQNLQPLR